MADRPYRERKFYEAAHRAHRGRLKRSAHRHNSRGSEVGPQLRKNWAGGDYLGKVYTRRPKHPGPIED